MKESYLKKGTYRVLKWAVSSWFFLFLTLFSFFYFQQIHKKEKLYQTFLEKKLVLEKKKVSLIEEQHELEFRIKSQSSKEWIELVLMKNLGLVPEGQTKVYFKK